MLIGNCRSVLYETQKSFAQQVFELRKKRNMNQIGEVVRLTAMSISTIESGLRSTTIEKLILLAQFFGVSTDCLPGLKDEP